MISKKPSLIVFSKVLEIPTFEQLQASLNILMLNTYYDFDDCLKKGVFTDLLKGLESGFVQRKNKRKVFTQVR